MPALVDFRSPRVRGYGPGVLRINKSAAQFAEIPQGVPGFQMDSGRQQGRAEQMALAAFTLRGALDIAETGVAGARAHGGKAVHTRQAGAGQGGGVAAGAHYQP